MASSHRYLKEDVLPASYDGSFFTYPFTVSQPASRIKEKRTEVSEFFARVSRQPLHARESATEPSRCLMALTDDTEVVQRASFIFKGSIATAAA